MNDCETCAYYSYDEEWDSMFVKWILMKMNTVVLSRDITENALITETVMNTRSPVNSDQSLLYADFCAGYRYIQMSGAVQ